MPDITTKLGLKKPLGNEVVSRAAYNENLDILEIMAAREQFPIKSLSYDAANNRIAITFGPGLAELFDGNNARAFVQKDADTTYYINAPAINTTYYVYIQSDGTFAHNTIGVIPGTAALLWQVTTGAELTTLTALDRRAVLSAAGARLAAHLAEIVISPQPNKILRLDANGKLPTSITGDAHTVDGAHAGTGPDNVLKLDSTGKVPLANIPTTNLNADKVDNIHFRVYDGTLQYDDGGGWKNLGGIKSVQRGLTTVLYGQTVNVTISAVDTSKSFITFPVCVSDEAGGADGVTYARLTSSTNLAIRNYGTDRNTEFAWEVVEFY